MLLAPSKTLDFESSAPAWATPTKPLFIDQARRIIAELSRLDEEQLAHLMHVSASIAHANHSRIASWGKLTKSAIWAYRGDVYKGMYADTLTKTDVDWAQRHLVIMSGLYGIVRPYDAISPYRLEMKTKLGVEGTKDLYDFWDRQLAEYVDSHSDGIICNLASDEYGRPVTTHSQSRVITPVFMDHRPNGKVGPAPIYNKMMRGVMAHWIIKNKVDDPTKLTEFAGHGYVYDGARSSSSAPAFSRSAMKPLVF